MKHISERQSKILKNLIEEYVKTASPVSSGLLSRKYDFDISPATIRIELGRLGEAGYLFQPHTSAGRVPTDKGYRFLVDLIEEQDGKEVDVERIMEFAEREFWKRMVELSRFMAENTSTFALSGLPERRLFSRAGWSRVLEQPEFNNEKMPLRFARLVRRIEKNTEKWRCEKEIHVFIGRENPFGRFEEFSVVMGRCRFEEGEGMIALAGPKRMPYKKNIGVLKRIKGWLDKRL